MYLCQKSFLNNATQEGTSLYFVISFVTYRQHEGQNFVTELEKSEKCEFETLHDSLIKDMIVCGTNDNSLGERLLHESELTLHKAISAGHGAEAEESH